MLDRKRIDEIGVWVENKNEIYLEHGGNILEHGRKKNDFTGKFLSQKKAVGRIST